MNFSNPQEHVPEAERNNCLIKERIRATYHRLPYKQLTKTMTKVLVMDSAKKLNFFPAKHGISQYYSPRMILHQQNLDYSKNCKYTFGTYVQAHDEPEPKNNLSPRTLDCIYLRYTDSHQGGHELLHIPTNKIITRRSITPLPITQTIIDQVSDIAKRENIPEGLKIANKDGLILYDSLWIAGVDTTTNEETEEIKEIEEQETENETTEDEMHPDNVEGCERDHKRQQYHEEEDNNEEDEDEGEEVEQEKEDKNPERTQDQEYETEDEIEIIFNSETESDEEKSQQELFDKITRTRSGRVSRPVHKYVTTHHGHLITQATKPEVYSIETAKVIATTINKINYLFAQTYSLSKGIKEFGEKGHQAAREEMKQLHERIVFKPILIEELTNIEK